MAPKTAAPPSGLASMYPDAQGHFHHGSGVIDNEPDSYHWTATKTVGTMYMRLGSDIDTLVGALADTAGMAGSDDAGRHWSAAYGPTADAAITAAASVVNTAGAFHNLMVATGLNYSNADTINTMLVARPSSTPGTKPTYAPGSVPDAFGGPADSPGLWWMIANYVKGHVWPNGHQDKLRAAATAWRDAGRAITASTQYLDGALEKLQTQRAPEIADITSAFNTLNEQCVSVGNQFEAIARACEDYASKLDDAHHKIIEELVNLVATTIAIELAAATAATVSGGSGAAAAQALEELELIAVGGRVARIIETFIDLVIGLSLFGGRIGPALETTTAALETYTGAAPVIAQMSKEGETVSNGFGAMEKLRRVRPNAAVEQQVRAATQRLTIDGKEYYVSGADPDILIPVSGKYDNPAITSAPKVPLYPGGPLKYYQYDGHLYPIKPKIVMGHKFGSENWRLLEEYTEKRMSQADYDQMMQDPKWYRVEDQYGNASHVYEDKTPR